MFFLQTIGHKITSHLLRKIHDRKETIPMKKFTLPFFKKGFQHYKTFLFVAVSLVIFTFGFFCFLISPTQAASDVILHDFELTTLDGNPFQLNSLLGKKTIVINFWASWCKPCRKEVPLLNKMKEDHKNEDIVFIGINAGEDLPRVKKFVELTDFQFQVLLDPKNKVADLYNIYALPHFLIISKDKKITYKKSALPEGLVKK